MSPTFDTKCLSSSSGQIYEYTIAFDDERLQVEYRKYHLPAPVGSGGPFTRAASDFLQFGLSPEACKSHFTFNCVRALRSDVPFINFTAFLVPIVVTLVFFDSAVTVIPVSGITTCDDVSQSLIIVWAYTILVIGKTGVCKELALTIGASS
ncbi:hypothetical protein PAXINDRAFT_13651 [Paxillus involutus ATCC 200175]|uniref:Uncharacterized protein n=1 Tax=Paxillus involutus ATCC 200175 TaxID=664439 RepID=A0A0C9TD74_PAXIN|nr:hypothetical protein PAXINDRAFT_13651 [Paxillus involutus ATCC 200175]